MTTSNIICSTDLDNGVGYNNELLFKGPSDLEFFKSMTMNNIVVMGRRTFESMGCRPLPKRVNIVVSSSKIGEDYDTTKFPKKNPPIFIRSMYHINYLVEDFNIDQKDIFYIGGHDIFANALDNGIDHIYKTVFDYLSPYKDTTFPPLPLIIDEDEQFSIIREGREMVYLPAEERYVTLGYTIYDTKGVY